MLLGCLVVLMVIDVFVFVVIVFGGMFVLSLMVIVIK